jgi:hypothetical protein
MTDSIQKLYDRFEKSFPKPTKFYNNGCCVAEENEQDLINVPLRELTEDILSMPIRHFGSCFGTFEQMAFFVPRIIELLSESEKGFDLMEYSCFWLLVAYQVEYRERGLWESIETAILDIFHERTSDMVIDRVDAETGVFKVRNGPWDELPKNSRVVEDILALFLFPVLSKRNNSDIGSDWDRFFENWANDKNAGRVAWLLEVIRQHCHGLAAEPYTLPNSLLMRLSEEEYIEQLVDRARSAIAKISSPTWFNDLMDCLPLDSQ